MGERGIRLSGGHVSGSALLELFISRVFNFDEAKALDTNAEKALMDSINLLSKDLPL